jgi:amino acid transporter
MVRYLIIMLAVLAVLMGTVWAGSVQTWWILPSMWIQVLVFLFIATLIIGFNLVRIRKNQPQVFVQFYLLSISVKMIAGLAFIFFLVWDNPAEAAPIATLFMVAYILFTFVEVAYLLNQNSKG